MVLSMDFQRIILGFVYGLVGGFITAYLYNACAGWFGGIEMEFE